jgi:phage shock protein A
MATIVEAREQPPLQIHVGESAVKQEIVPPVTDILEISVKRGEEQTQLLQMALTQVQALEKENKYRESQISQLQGNVSQLLGKVSQLQGEADRFRTERQDLMKYKENYEKAEKIFLGDK